ncbi:hypothetical protein STEG23_000830, partial [Scotinomys teguina]
EPNSADAQSRATLCVLRVLLVTNGNDKTHQLFQKPGIDPWMLFKTKKNVLVYIIHYMKDLPIRAEIPTILYQQESHIQLVLKAFKQEDKHP